MERSQMSKNGSEVLKLQERVLPGRRVYVPVDDVKHSAWKQLVGTKTISKERLKQLETLGLAYEIVDHQPLKID